LDSLELIGWAAAAATFTAHSMKTMLPLRALAICANVLFITYGSLTAAWPVLALHAALLPFNTFRLVQLVRTGRQVAAAAVDKGLPEGLQAYLRPVAIAPGAVLFRKGDPADRIYYLRSGRILLEELGTTMQAGELFGEVAFFSRSGERTLTARCLGACDVLAMREADFTRLYYQDPAFGFFVLRLLARRLEDNARQPGG
jgi:hypothetical protein